MLEQSEEQEAKDNRVDSRISKANMRENFEFTFRRRSVFVLSRGKLDFYTMPLEDR